jgi:hypothetical protein
MFLECRLSVRRHFGACRVLSTWVQLYPLLGKWLSIEMDFVEHLKMHTPQKYLCGACKSYACYMRVVGIRWRMQTICATEMCHIAICDISVGHIDMRHRNTHFSGEYFYMRHIHFFSFIFKLYIFPKFYIFWNFRIFTIFSNSWTSRIVIIFKLVLFEISKYIFLVFYVFSWFYNFLLKWAFYF